MFRGGSLRKPLERRRLGDDQGTRGGEAGAQVRTKSQSKGPGTAGRGRGAVSLRGSPQHCGE